MTKAFLSLGSNIEPEKNVYEALKLLSEQVRILEVSTVYLTEPLLRKSQAKFYNCVVKIQTDLEPEALKSKTLQTIEEKLGRKKTKDKYASRTIDIDILLYGNLYFSTENLVIPDPEIEKRPFLAIPLYEIEPDLVIPQTNEQIVKIADRFENSSMIKLDEYTNKIKCYVKHLHT